MRVRVRFYGGMEACSLLPSFPAAAETPSETTSVWRSPRGGRASVRGCCGGLSPYQLRASRLTDAEGGTKRGRRWEGGSEQVRPSAPRATEAPLRHQVRSSSPTRNDPSGSRRGLCSVNVRASSCNVVCLRFIPTHLPRGASMNTILPSTR